MTTLTENFGTFSSEVEDLDLRGKMVWLISGGSGAEREGSIISGRDTAQALTELGIDFREIDLDEVPDTVFNPGDIAFLSTHGQWGEDGKIQGYLETRRVSYTGPRVLGAAVSMHKRATNLVAQALGIKVPAWLHVSSKTGATILDEFHQQYGPKLILRPSSGGGSRGIVLTHTFKDLYLTLKLNDWEHDDYLLNQFVEGTEVSAACISIESEITMFPILQTEYSSEIYDYESKHDETRRRHVCPAPLHESSRSIIEAACVKLYAALGLEGFARFDFIVDRAGVPNFLEVNSIPGLSKKGNLATMAKAAGMSYSQLISLELASATRLAGYTV